MAGQLTTWRMMLIGNITYVAHDFLCNEEISGSELMDRSSQGELPTWSINMLNKIMMTTALLVPALTLSAYADSIQHPVQKPLEIGHSYAPDSGRPYGAHMVTRAASDPIREDRPASKNASKRRR